MTTDDLLHLICSVIREHGPMPRARLIQLLPPSALPALPIAIRDGINSGVLVRRQARFAIGKEN